LLLIHTRLWICLISSPDSGRGATRNSFSKPENRRIIQEDTSKRDFSIRFQGDRYLLVLDGKVQQDATYMLDPGHEPRWIDWIASIRDKTVTLLGIYEFHGDTLVIAIANAGERRPKSLATEGPDSPVIYRCKVATSWRDDEA